MSTDILFTDCQLGDLALKNRFVLAPLTRGRAGETRVPNDLMAEYYHQRSEAGMIITEATVVSVQGNGWVGSPGIYSDAMQEGWKKVTNKLQGTNSYSFLQLWHCGRASHSDFHQGKPPVSASTVKINGDKIHTPLGKKDYEAPRALEVSEIKQTVQDYKNASQRAKDAGFAGVEVHAANGYLINQFLDAKSNKRVDEYGGSLENRFRFLREILDEVTKVFPSKRVGVRLSPNGVFNDMGSPDYRELFDYVISQLNRYSLGYLHVMDGLGFGFHEQGKPYTLADVKSNYEGLVMGNCGYTARTAADIVETKKAELIAFGRPFITNPDLPSRIKHNLELTPFDDSSSWYGDGAEGYTSFKRADEN